MYAISRISPPQLRHSSGHPSPTRASGCDLPADAAVDSHDLVTWLMGKAVAPARTTLVHNTNPGRYAIRHGHWLLVDGTIGYTAPPAAVGTAASAAGGG